MPRKLIGGSRQSTPLIVWLAAFICTIIAIGVIIGGIVVFVGYLVIHPRVPFIGVTFAHLDLIANDYAGILQTQITIDMKAQNDNLRAHAMFSDIHFKLSFQGIPIAHLVAAPFEMSKNSSQDLHYVVQSSNIPLTPEQVEEVDFALKRDEIGFDLKGHARARWIVGPLHSPKLWCNLNCQLKFHPINGSYINSLCTSESK